MRLFMFQKTSLMASRSPANGGILELYCLKLPYNNQTECISCRSSIKNHINADKIEAKSTATAGPIINIAYRL